MAIKRRSNDADEEGAGNRALIRRPSRKILIGKKPSEKAKFALKGELAEVVKLYNKETPGTIHRLSESVGFGRLKTGILTVDLCLAGGFLKSRAGMIYGERSAGKSTLMARTMKSALEQDPEGVAVVIDTEGTSDRSWMKFQGVDTDRVVIVEPSTGEEAVDQADALIRTTECCFLGVDSIAMLTPFKEIDSSAEDQQMGIQARLIGKMLRRLQNAILQERRREHYPTIMLLNQFRMKITMFGDPRTLPGGKALEFVTSQQLEAKNSEVKGKDGTVLYNEHTVIVTKDKTGGRFKEAKFKLIRDESTDLPVGYIDQAKSILEFGERAGIVRGRYEIDGIRHKFKSADAFRDFLVENPKVEAEVCANIVRYYQHRWGVDIT